MSDVNVRGHQLYKCIKSMSDVNVWNATTGTLCWIFINILPLIICTVLISLYEACGSLNTLCCSFLITRSGFVIMRCRSCAFINCRATCYFMYSRYNIIRSIPLIIRCSKLITCCGYIFSNKHPTITPVNYICRDQVGKTGTKIRDQITIV